MPAQRTGGSSAHTWSGWYYAVRMEMEFRYGRRGIPVYRYKEQWILGRTPQEAAKAIEMRDKIENEP